MSNMFTKVLISLFALAGIMLSAFAKENTITAVKISKPKELKGAYQLTVKANEKLNYKAKTESEDSIFFDIKNAKRADNISVIYEGIINVDGVIVQQISDDKVRIIVNGENTSTTELVFSTPKVKVAPKSDKKQLVLNRPMKDYKPVTEIEELPETTEGEASSNEKGFDFNSILTAIFSIFNNKTDLTIAISAILLVISGVVAKGAFGKLAKSQEPLIGLKSAYDQSYEDEEIKEDILDNMFGEKVETKIEEQYKEPTKAEIIERAAKNIQEISAKRNAATATATQSNAVAQTYALGQYQNSQKNPYTTRPKTSSPFVNTYEKRETVKPVKASVLKVQEDLAQQKANVSLQNLKFLESVTKIYEQSGRSDLASGLRSGVVKRKSIV